MFFLRSEAGLSLETVVDAKDETAERMSVEDVMATRQVRIETGLAL